LILALERRPRTIFLSFGDLRPYAAIIARAGIPLIAQVQTLADARMAIAEGAQIIVAQGTEAGGHGGVRATMALVPAIVDAVGDVPVVAAGGIADGRGLAASLMLGAAGVLCGTAFYVALESLAHPNVKAAAVRASGDYTVRGQVFDMVRGLEWPGEWKIRTLANNFYRQWAGNPEELKASLSEQQRAYRLAQQSGDVATAAVIVGEAVDLVNEIESASAIVARITKGAQVRIAAFRS
jgi:nitronate monooxygenase